jgi:hypothetical protein
VSSLTSRAPTAPGTSAVSAVRVPPTWLITAVLSLVYLIVAPPSPDLAAASYRGNLFSRVGFSLWDNSWYGGHHLPAYSLLAPPISALIGPQPLAAISMIAATALFAALIARRFPARSTRLAAIWFALGASVSLLSSRVPFDLGLAIGLAALLAAQRKRLVLALALSVLSAIASPVAGAFLALAFLAWGVSGPARLWPGVLTVATLAPIGLLVLVFPEGGAQPFVASAFYPDLAGVLVLGALMPSGERLLRIGAALYALALLGSYLLPTAVGGNVDRLGALAAGPVAACVLAGGPLRSWRVRALIALTPVLFYWQATAPVTDFAAAASDPAVHASYYTPLLGELRRLDVGYSTRVEVVATADHWEARWLAPHVMLARGWERQLDSFRNGLFYNQPTVTSQSYREWLGREAISYVAMADAPLDYSAGSEARVVKSSPSYLREVWHSKHWRLWAVRDPQPLVQRPASLLSVSTDSLSMYAPRPGLYTVRVHFTPYWALAGGDGCVAPTGKEEWTQIQARKAGDLHMVISFSLGRILSRSARCD